MDARQLIRISKALGDATRFGIFQALVADGELSCGDLTKHFPIAQPTVSHHVKVLIDAGLVSARKAGQHSYFSALPATLTQYRQALGALGAPAARRPVARR